MGMSFLGTQENDTGKISLRDDHIILFQQLQSPDHLNYLGHLIFVQITHLIKFS